MNIRSLLYLTARLLGDVNASRRGPQAVQKRIVRRIVGRITGRLLGKALP